MFGDSVGIQLNWINGLNWSKSTSKQWANWNGLFWIWGTWNGIDRSSAVRGAMQCQRWARLGAADMDSRWCGFVAMEGTGSMGEFSKNWGLKPHCWCTFLIFGIQTFHHMWCKHNEPLCQPWILFTLTQYFYSTSTTGWWEFPQQKYAHIGSPGNLVPLMDKYPGCGFILGSRQMDTRDHNEYDKILRQMRQPGAWKIWPKNGRNGIESDRVHLHLGMEQMYPDSNGGFALWKSIKEYQYRVLPDISTTCFSVCHPRNISPADIPADARPAEIQVPWAQSNGGLETGTLWWSNLGMESPPSMHCCRNLWIYWCCFFTLQCISKDVFPI